MSQDSTNLNSFQLHVTVKGPTEEEYKLLEESVTIPGDAMGAELLNY